MRESEVGRERGRERGRCPKPASKDVVEGVGVCERERVRERDRGGGDPSQQARKTAWPPVCHLAALPYSFSCMWCSLPRVQGSGFEFRIQGAGFRVQGSGFKVQGSGCRVQGAGFRVQGLGFRVQGAGFRVQGSGFRVQGSRFKVPSDRAAAQLLVHVVQPAQG